MDRSMPKVHPPWTAGREPGMSVWGGEFKKNWDGGHIAMWLKPLPLFKVLGANDLLKMGRLWLATLLTFLTSACRGLCCGRGKSWRSFVLNSYATENFPHQGWPSDVLFSFPFSGTTVPPSSFKSGLRDVHQLSFKNTSMVKRTLAFSAHQFSAYSRHTEP